MILTQNMQIFVAEMWPMNFNFVQSTCSVQRSAQQSIRAWLTDMANAETVREAFVTVCAARSRTEFSPRFCSAAAGCVFSE
jgi:hypothetical protein